MTKAEIKKKHPEHSMKIKDGKEKTKKIDLKDIIVEGKTTENNKEKKVEKVKAESIDNDEEPSWYHYLIVLVVIAVIIFGIMFLINLGNPDETIKGEKNGLFYTFKYNYDGTDYNIHFRTDEMTLINEDLLIEPTLEDILNSNNLTMMFYNINGTDNSQLTIGSSFLTSFLTGVHNMKFADFVSVEKEDFNCNGSTLGNKFILIDPSSNREGIFYNKTNGCIQFETYNASRTILLTEKFVYNSISVEDE